MINAQELADRYVALWNETDSKGRLDLIKAFFAPDGVHYVRTLEARGYDALEQRVKGSHDKNVRDGGNRFRARQDARLLRDMVTFHWEMIPATGDDVLAVGLEIIVVDPDGRVQKDYQFV
jgi:hypothetical protein